MDTAAKLTKLLGETGVSQTQLGRETGMGQTAISRFCTKGQRMRLDQACKIATALGVSVEALADDAVYPLAADAEGGSPPDSARVAMEAARRLGPGAVRLVLEQAAALGVEEVRRRLDLPADLARILDIVCALGHREALARLLLAPERGGPGAGDPAPASTNQVLRQRDTLGELRARLDRAARPDALEHDDRP